MKKDKEKAIEWWDSLSIQEKTRKRHVTLGNLIRTKDLVTPEILFIYNFYHQ